MKTEKKELVVSQEDDGMEEIRDNVSEGGM